MTIDAIIKISLIGIITVVLSTVLTETKKEYALLLRLSAVGAVCLVCIKAVSEKLSAFISKAQSLCGQSELITILFKGAIICIVTSIVCEICNDSGNASLSKAVEITSRMLLIITALPLVNAVIETAFAFIS